MAAARLHRRFGIALGLSLAAHAGLAPFAARPAGGRAPPPVLRASLAPAPPAAVREPAAEESPAPVPAPAAARAGPPAAVPAAIDSEYYPLRSLDVYPAAVAPLRFDYPAAAARAGIGGRVVLALSIDETGAVTRLAVEEAEPAGYFEEAARAALAQARFTPGRKDGRAVRSRITVAVDYPAGAAAGVPR